MLAIFVLAASAAAQSQVDPLMEQIRLSRERLGQIRADQTRLRQEMDALTVQVHDAQAELHNLDRQARNQASLLRELDHNLEIRDQQVLAITADLLRTKDELVEKRMLFARRVIPRR